MHFDDFFILKPDKRKMAAPLVNAMFISSKLIIVCYYCVSIIFFFVGGGGRRGDAYQLFFPVTYFVIASINSLLDS